MEIYWTSSGKTDCVGEKKGRSSCPNLQHLQHPNTIQIPSKYNWSSLSRAKSATCATAIPRTSHFRGTLCWCGATNCQGDSDGNDDIVLIFRWKWPVIDVSFCGRRFHFQHFQHACLNGHVPRLRTSDAFVPVRKAPNRGTSWRSGWGISNVDSCWNLAGKPTRCFQNGACFLGFFLMSAECYDPAATSTLKSWGSQGKARFWYGSFMAINTYECDVCITISVGFLSVFDPLPAAGNVTSPCRWLWRNGFGSLHPGFGTLPDRKCHCMSLWSSLRLWWWPVVAMVVTGCCRCWCGWLCCLLFVWPVVVVILGDLVLLPHGRPFASGVRVESVRGSTPQHRGWCGCHRNQWMKALYNGFLHREPITEGLYVLFVVCSDFVFCSVVFFSHTHFDAKVHCFFSEWGS